MHRREMDKRHGKTKKFTGFSLVSSKLTQKWASWLSIIGIGRNLQQSRFLIYFIKDLNRHFLPNVTFLYFDPQNFGTLKLLLKNQNWILQALLNTEQFTRLLNSSTKAFIHLLASADSGNMPTCFPSLTVGTCLRSSEQPSFLKSKWKIMSPPGMQVPFGCWTVAKLWKNRIKGQT